MKIGQVCIAREYVVDMDDPEMIEEAKKALVDDFMRAAKLSEFRKLIEVIPATGALGFEESDIPSFLSELAKARKKEAR